MCQCVKEYLLCFAWGSVVCGFGEIFFCVGCLVMFVLLFLGFFCVSGWVFLKWCLFCGCYNACEYNTALSTKKSLFANNNLELVFKTQQAFCLNTAGDPWQFFDRRLSTEGAGKGRYYICHFLNFSPPYSLEPLMCSSHGCPCKPMNL